MSSTRVKSLTKEELRNALIMNGIAVPSSAAKKEEFQKLYDERVLPLLKRSEFSSDDEQDEPVHNGRENGTFEEESEKKEEIEAYVKALSNEELYSELMSVGFSGGPVVASTRLLYETQLMSKMALNKSTNGSPASGSSAETEKVESVNGFSDSDDDAAVETASRASRSSHGSNSSPRKRGRPPTGTTKRDTVASSFRSSESTSSVKSPTRTRLQRRSETPRHVVPEPEEAEPNSGSSDENRSTERDERRRNEMRNSMFPETGVSYFKERPGYASTTTSNVLPLKPSASFRNRSAPYTFEDEDKPAAVIEKKGSTIWFTFLTLFFAIAVALVAAYIYTIWADGVDSVPDELDQLLETMENP